jgi:membrane protease YdiL (CAAX protease family)
MKDNKGSFKLYREKPVFQFFVSLMIIMGVGGVLSFILNIAGIFFIGGELSMLTKSATSLGANDIKLLRYILIVQDIALFTIPSIIILRLMNSDASGNFTEFKIPQLKEIGLVVILTFCIFPVTSFTGQFNTMMHLPGWLSGVENWMTDMETNADTTTDLLIVSKSFGAMMFNLLTFGLITAISEELIFRGVFQKIFYNMFKSGHVAIWVTAFLFSAIHFQFFGFIPRFILGLAFGYLFFWSGNLWMPMIAHFVNNAFPVILVYVQGLEKLNTPSDVPLWHQAIYLPIPVVIGFVILYYFRNKKINSDVMNIKQEPVS